MSASGILETPTASKRTGFSLKLLANSDGGHGAVLLALIAIVGFLLMSCGESGPPSPDSTLHLVPENADLVTIMNITEIFASPELAEGMGLDSSEEFLLGLTLDDLEEMALVEWEGNSIRVVKGSFEFDDLRDELEELEVEESSYRGYELWERFVLLEEDRYLIDGTSQSALEEVLGNLYRDEGHLAGAEDNDLKRILDKAGDGWLALAGVSDDECTIRRCRGFVNLVSEYDADREEINGKVVLLFSSERAAEAAADDYDEVANLLKQDWEDGDIVAMESDGEFVIVTLTEDIEDEDTSRAEEPPNSPPAQEQVMQPVAPEPAASRAMRQPAVLVPVAPAPALAPQPTATPVPPATQVPAAEPAAQPALPAPTAAPATDVDRAALTALYHATDGPNWNNVSNWLTDAPLAEWYGVGVDSNGRVIELNLHQNGLTGTIPPELGNLSNLVHLELGGNNLTGTIPAELGKLSKLEFLSFWNNNLTGNVPPELGNLSNLGALNLSQNNLTGELPDSLAALQLSDIWFHSNAGLCAPSSLRGWLEGILITQALVAGISYRPICAHADDMAALTALYHATDGPNWNNVTNWLTDAPLSQWHGVGVNRNGRVIGLNLGSNNLSGTIPPELGNLSNLDRLELVSNDLTGTIPAELGKLSKLQLLWLGQNKLTGELPEGLAALPLSEIWFDKNQGLCAPPDMAGWLQSVNSNGPICAYAADEAALAALYHAADGPNWNNVTNWLTDAPLSQWHGVTVNRNGRVTGLNLSQNGLKGTMPSDLGNLSELQALHLSGNGLTGSIPSELGNLSRLEVLWLNGNNLTGNLPAQLGNLSNLTTLYIGQNDLTGELPRGLANLPLNTVFFGENPRLCAHASMRGWLESINARGRIC